jgi:hypothetical protein
MEGTNYVVISTDVEKAFGETQHPFMTEMLTKSDIGL